MASNSSPLLINESPLQVLPSLAVALGNVNEAIILQQIQCLLKEPKSGRVDKNGQNILEEPLKNGTVNSRGFLLDQLKNNLSLLKTKEL
jgi:hypothetical protein